MHEVPAPLGGVRPAPRRHAGEPYAVLDDVEELAVGELLRRRRAQVGRARSTGCARAPSARCRRSRGSSRSDRRSGTAPRPARAGSRGSDSRRRGRPGGSPSPGACARSGPRPRTARNAPRCRRGRPPRRARRRLRSPPALRPLRPRRNASSRDLSSAGRVTRRARARKQVSRARRPADAQGGGPIGCEPGEGSSRVRRRRATGSRSRATRGCAATAAPDRR